MIFRYRRSYFSVLLALILSFQSSCPCRPVFRIPARTIKNRSISISSPRETEEPAEETSAPQIPVTWSLIQGLTRKVNTGNTGFHDIGAENRPVVACGYSSDEQAETMIRDHKVGGIVLFRRNFDTLKNFIRLQAG